MMAVAMMMFSTRLPSTATIASTKSGKTISKASKHDDLDVYRPVGRLFGNFYAAQRDTLQRHSGAGCFLLDYGDDESGLFMKYLRRGSGLYRCRCIGTDSTSRRIGSAQRSHPDDTRHLLRRVVEHVWHDAREAETIARLQDMGLVV